MRIKRRGDNLKRLDKAQRAWMSLRRTHDNGNDGIPREIFQVSSSSRGQSSGGCLLTAAGIQCLCQLHSMATGAGAGGGRASSPLLQSHLLVDRHCLPRPGSSRRGNSVTSFAIRARREVLLLALFRLQNSLSCGLRMYRRRTFGAGVSFMSRAAGMRRIDVPYLAF